MLYDDELMLWVINVCCGSQACLNYTIMSYNWAWSCMLFWWPYLVYSWMCVASWCTKFNPVVCSGPVVESGVSWCIWWDQWSIAHSVMEAVTILMCSSPLVGLGASSRLPYKVSGKVLLIQWWDQYQFDMLLSIGGIGSKCTILVTYLWCPMSQYRICM